MTSADRMKKLTRKAHQEQADRKAEAQRVEADKQERNRKAAENALPTVLNAALVIIEEAASEGKWETWVKIYENAPGAKGGWLSTMVRTALLDRGFQADWPTHHEKEPEYECRTDDAHYSIRVSWK